MRHDCEWVVVRCMDWRLNASLAEYLRQQGIPEEHDLISWPGSGKSEQIPATILNASIELHNVSKLMLVWHTDCGAYGGRQNCGGTEEADREFQLKELRAAAFRIQGSCRLEEVRLVLVHIKDDGQILYEDVVPE